MADQEDKEGGGIRRIIVNRYLVEELFFCLRASGLGGHVVKSFGVREAGSFRGERGSGGF